MKLWHRYRSMVWEGPVEVPAATPQAVAMVFRRIGVRVTMMREIPTSKMDAAIAILAEDSMDAPTVIYTGIARPDKRRSPSLEGSAVRVVAVPVDANMAAWIEHESARQGVGASEVARVAIREAMHRTSRLTADV